MSAEYVAPSFTALANEQALVQQGKRQDRLIAGYEDRIFHGTRSVSPPDLFNDFLSDSIREEMSLNGLLHGLHEAKNYRQIHWADMGCGEARAMQQVAKDENIGHLAKMTAIDIADNLPFTPGIEPSIGQHTNSHNSQSLYLIRANIEEVVLDQPADLITAIEVIQYLHNPLKALCNWYNQLDDDGIAVIASKFNWSKGLRKTYSLGDPEVPFGRLIVDQLVQQGAQVMLGDGMLTNSFGDYGRMALQKITGTKLQLNASIAAVESTPVDYYKTVYYESADESQPIMELL